MVIANRAAKPQTIKQLSNVSYFFNRKHLAVGRNNFGGTHSFSECKITNNYLISQTPARKPQNFYVYLILQPVNCAVNTLFSAITATYAPGARQPKGTHSRLRPPQSSIATQYYIYIRNHPTSKKAHRPHRRAFRPAALNRPHDKTATQPYRYARQPSWFVIRPSSKAFFSVPFGPCTKS